MKKDYFVTQDDLEVAKVTFSDGVSVWVDADLAHYNNLEYKLTTNNDIQLRVNGRTIAQYLGGQTRHMFLSLNRRDFTSRNYINSPHNCVLIPEIGYAKVEDGFRTSARKPEPSQIVDNEFEACKIAAEVDEKLRDRSFDFKSCRLYEDDLVDLYLSGVVSYEESTLRHIMHYKDNAWFVYRYDLVNYFNEHNIPIPEFELDEEGFMIEPHTGLYLNPAIRGSKHDWYFNSDSENSDKVNDIKVKPYDSNCDTYYTIDKDYLLIRDSAYYDLHKKVSDSTYYADVLSFLVLQQVYERKPLPSICDTLHITKRQFDELIRRACNTPYQSSFEYSRITNSEDFLKIKDTVELLKSCYYDYPSYLKKVSDRDKGIM